MAVKTVHVEKEAAMFRKLLCKLGYHSYVSVGKGNASRYYRCEHCGKKILKWLRR